MKSLYEFMAGLTLLAFFGLLLAMLSATGCKLKSSVDRSVWFAVITIDGCQYITSTGGSQVIIHKANCPNH